MSDEKKPKRIIGMRSRVVIGDEVPKEDENTEVIGQDVLVHITPDQLEEGMEIIGVASTVVIGDSKTSDLINATIRKAQELNLPDSPEIIKLGKSALSAQDKRTLKTRLRVFIDKCKQLTPLAALAKELLIVYKEISM